jgi:hypothetical protein
MYVLLLVAVAATPLVTTSPMSVLAWELEVDLSNSSFGSDSVCASVEGYYGYGPVRRCTKPGPNAEVSFNVPDDETSYEVCTWGGIASAIFSNCNRYDNPSATDIRVTGQFVGG